MDFANSTALASDRLHALLLRHTQPYKHNKLTVRVRYSRGADFSGTCYYNEGRIYVNVGRHVRYPYTLATHVAKAYSGRTHWGRELFRLTVRDGYELTLFVYLHELYHYLVKAGGRNPKRKEAMCDRFAARALVDAHGCRLTDAHGRPVARERWDFKDLDAFVAAAPREPRQPPPRGPIPVVIRGLPGVA